MPLKWSSSHQQHLSTLQNSELLFTEPQWDDTSPATDVAEAGGGRMRLGRGIKVNLHISR